MLATRGSLAVVAVALVPVGVAMGARAGSAARPPCVAPETTRHHVFPVNLDRGRTRERVIVSNFDGEATPSSTFMVCKRYGGKWARVQRQRIVISPGSRSSGLVDAWAGDLNRHGRVEVAARDRLTPSAGEVLTIFRQRARYALKFTKLQSIPGMSSNCTSVAAPAPR